MSKLTFYYGVMASGKSNELIGTYYKYTPIGKKTIVMKPSIDTRDTDIVSRSGSSIPIDILIQPNDSILNYYNTFKDAFVILVDEAQFLTEEQVFELYFITKKCNIPVITYGLRSDFQGKLFAGSQALFECADVLKEMQGVCKICGKTSKHNARKVNGEYVFEGEQVVIGADETYDPLCGKCYIENVLKPKSKQYQKVLNQLNYLEGSNS